MSSTTKHLLLSASLISAAVVFFIGIRKRKRVIEDGGDLVLVKLLPLENIVYLRREDTPISTITWFHGDHNQAAAILKDRTLQIFKKNPWLAGRLVKTRDGVYLSYHENVDETSFNPFFHMLDSPVHRHTPVEQMAKAAVSLKLSNRPQEPLWRVVVVPCKLEPSSHFAVVVSLSHVIGGGQHTFYSIHNMLCSTNDIVKLSVHRIETSEQQQKNALGQAEYNLTVSVPFLLNGMFGLLYSAFVAPLTGKHMEQAYIWGEKDDFEELKIDKAELGKVPFVSTHDILAAWFFQTTGCSFGLVSVDFLHGGYRRLEGHTPHHAGNYWSLIFYQPPDFASPALIRKSLSTLKRVKTTSSMPSLWAIIGATYAITSNWATFAAPNRIEGCREELHMPLHDYSKAGLPSSFSALIIFRATSDKVGILVTGVGPVLRNLEKSLVEQNNAVPLHDYKKVPRG